MRYSFWPRTRLGWWAVGLASVFVVLMVVNSYVIDQWVVSYQWIGVVVRGYALLVLASALLAAWCALPAIMRYHDTAVLVWSGIVPLLLSIVFMLGEVLSPH